MRNICCDLCDGFMVDAKNASSGNLFEKKLDDLQSYSSTCSKNNPFIKWVILILLTTTSFILLIAGTATTAISYPPKPPEWNDSHVVRTALDGDYKLVGPLLLMAGIFVFIVNAAFCFGTVREAYYASRNIHPDIPSSSMSVFGGPFFLAVPNPVNLQEMSSLALSRQLWAIPNAPTPDFSIDGIGLKSLQMRSSSAGKNHQPPFNPEIRNDVEKS